MRRTSASLVAGTLVAALAWASSPSTPAVALDPSAGVADLTQDLNQILSDSRLTIARAGVVVKSAESGEELYATDAGKLLIPASNTKLFTSAAAAETLGLDYRFTTSVLSTGRKAGKVLTGDLVLRGTGDPTMLAEDYDALAAKVARAGVKVVTGKLVADDSWFDAQRLGNDWAWDDETAYYAAPISALTASPDKDYDAGSVIVAVAAENGKVKVTTTPDTGYLKIVNRATAGSETDVLIERQHGTRTVVITGTVADPYQEWVAVDDPTAYASSLFRESLARHGVKVLGRTTTGAAPKGAKELAAHESMTLGELLVPFMKLSNNIHAEILTKAMGRKAADQGTWAAGLKVTTDFATTNGAQVINMRDGSGLSRRDGFSPGSIVQFLSAVRGKPWFDTWYKSLPIAGESERFVGGTLRSRMAGTPAAGNVHAKTGSLTGVTALSGYVTSADGEPLIFSIMLNQYLSGSPKDIEDKIAVRLAQFSRASASGEPVELRASDPGPAGDLECSWLKPAQC
ncbi:D-alanyl-D-alanine carboxypeptidase/D-alanyl-D-alanine-endopeptidase [Nonomuraea sp. KC401]|uniref:D-alanyl-D-alanine carboxypeptidase/D-alanyl-D-alanine endopeptidase n=1 Tax=unclassified Nonomuraea TaxID=2593643 RepID=UPI0010FE4AF8|nr:MULTISPECIES: D-alanyl-D-alanine carboxypeptidase/D-alanyl-D-alanine-endopeptidase [unclassified Nonomuraea]NBE96081.1 D-alanyl-D-alanine carboxypeptidase/D-alanyl-D-alanine-endopeptidase [Nonomuraea sp. K271]TLF80280.1 D-alanyl-D-alanine carboxypeptidase/D-alanyl-D-alanine-endopeptidase [Nonomuraea sp. KC401]